MIDPEQALDRARAALRAQRAAGRYPDPPPAPQPPSAADSRRALLESAFVEPGDDVLHSTRRHGAPITAVKRLLHRALAQYHGELIANQTRFNLALIAHLDQIETRLDALEHPRPDGPTNPSAPPAGVEPRP